MNMNFHSYINSVLTTKVTVLYQLSQVHVARASKFTVFEGSHYIGPRTTLVELLRKNRVI